MCIAILNKTSILPLETIKHSFENNPDGSGICAVINNRMIIHKEMNPDNYVSLYDRYVELRKQTDKPMLLHFRIGTSGRKDERNIHPFLVTKKLALIHNGIISYNIVNDDYSDTWHFTELLKSLKNPNRLLNVASIEFQMFSAFSKTSKIALLHTSGSYSILNENYGHWINDTWYSNATYKRCGFVGASGQKAYHSIWEDSDWNFGHQTQYDTKIAVRANVWKERGAQWLEK